MTDFFPIGELIDRYCIARLKFDRTQKNQSELEFYQKCIEHIDVDKISMEIKNLYDVNSAIWDLESQLRSGLENHVPLNEIGQRAIEIRNWNNKRIRLKNIIAGKLGCPIKEIKQDHISQ